MKVCFVEARSNVDVAQALKLNLQTLRFKKIGLATTVQHIHQINKVKELLEKAGKKVFIGKSIKKESQGIKATYPSQVLGCDVSAPLSQDSKVDCFLYIGTGEFHPLGLAIKTSKPVFVLNPFTKKLSQISEQEVKKFLAKKAARIYKAKQAKTYGILLSTKPGQYKPELADEIKAKLEKQNKKAFLFLMENISSQELMNFPQIEAWINTACPRIVDDDFSKLIVNCDEI